MLARHSNPKIAGYRLQIHLEEIEFWCNRWKIKLCPSKCIAIYFTKATRIMKPPPVILNTYLPWSEKVKYLGIFLDHRLTYAAQIGYSLTKHNMAKRQLYTFFAENSSLNIHCRKTLYVTVIRPKILYGCQIWAVAAKTSLHRLQSKQNLMIKRIANVPYYVRAETLHIELKLESIGEFIKKKCCKIFQQYSQCP